MTNYMKMRDTLKNHLFTGPGVTVLVDGQYGSTGKGVVAALLAELFHDKVDMVLSNAGPNSGHTSYFKGRKIVLKQLPTFGVTATLMTGIQMPIMLTAGAIIERRILQKECSEYNSNVFVHPSAAVITQLQRDLDEDNVSHMASTGMGVGPALIAKLERNANNVFGCYRRPSTIGDGEYPGSHANGIWNGPQNTIIFMEVSQGFSLGINSGFYPYTTTRECTVSQAMADAGLPPTAFNTSVMSIRTFPIRVGDTEGSSGPCYHDQEEISWEELGQEPEYTTVTNRVRRVFTFSIQQFKDALRANAPDVVFLNFMNYLPADVANVFAIENVIKPYREVMGKDPILLLGWGPESCDVTIWGGE